MIFIYNYVFFYLQECGDGRKTQKENGKRKSPLVAHLSPPFYDMEAHCFPVPEKHQKQAGPTLSKKGFLI